MPFYADHEHFCDVMTDVFGRAMADPALLQAAQDSQLIVQLVTEEPDALLTVDGRATPPEIVCGPSAHVADVSMRMPADLLHQIWMGEVKLLDALFSGQIEVEGPIMRAGSVVGLFREVEHLYRQTLEDRGLV